MLSFSPFTDINECDSNPCMNSGLCSNEVNTYTCDCTGTGFSGQQCETGSMNSLSIVRVYYVSIERNKVCCLHFLTTFLSLDIDECQSNPCQNSGNCNNGDNEYTCDCSGTGYEGSHCEIGTQ